ncbi:MAG: aminoacyl-histidine dipeptidase [Marinilabiliaceae bacterium]|nr:aminoacyl-histidine dipeptidase [Marinilabiliaceae bacterium]
MTIKQLEPQTLWNYFYDLTQIPRPSKHEQKVVDYIVGFAVKHNLEYIKDDVGNVIIRKPATLGREKIKGIILQAHVDMVPQKNSDKIHDFIKDGIETIVDKEWVKANNTTLGADNGIGVAAILSVLASETIKHGPLEGLFTIDEETGMTGAVNLKPGLLKGEILINTDSEDEGELYVGCAGGSNASCQFEFAKVDIPKNHIAFKLSLSGLKGGHSGMDIILGRGNANKLMIRILKRLVSECGARLASIEGGSLRNAIPREAFAVVTIPLVNDSDLRSVINEFNNIFRYELGNVEPLITLQVKEVPLPLYVIDEVTQDDMINAVQGCPNGVIRMSDSMTNLVETSTNLAIVKSDDKHIHVLSLIRSSVDSAKADVESTIESIFRLAGADVKFHSRYPGWQPNINSAILKAMKTVYVEKFGVIPQVRAIHAGLECGILGGIYPNWDMISFGPTIKYPHSPDEKVHIESVKKFWDFLVATLEYDI